MSRHPGKLLCTAAICTTLLVVIRGASAASIQIPAETARLAHSDLPGYSVATSKCGICHSADYIQYQPPGMSLTQWTAEMKKMQHSYGAPIDDRELQLVAIYLTDSYGDRSTVSVSDRQQKPTQAPATNSTTTPPAQSPDAQSLLTANGCLGCHSLREKVVGPAYHDVAQKYHDDRRR